MFLKNDPDQDGGSQDINQGLTAAFEADDHLDDTKNLRARSTEPLTPPLEPRVFPMSSPSPPTLQQLCRLNRSSPGFHGQLNNVLYGKEYQQCVENLKDYDLVWLIDYLDKVRYHVSLPAPRLSQRRPSIV